MTEFEFKAFDDVGREMQRVSLDPAGSEFKAGFDDALMHWGVGDMNGVRECVLYGIARHFYKMGKEA